jgi:hypothetical protein
VFRVRVSPREASHLFNSPIQSLIRRRELLEELASLLNLKKGFRVSGWGQPQRGVSSLQLTHTEFDKEERAT